MNVYREPAWEQCDVCECDSSRTGKDGKPYCDRHGEPTTIAPEWQVQRAATIEAAAAELLEALQSARTCAACDRIAEVYCPEDGDDPAPYCRHCIGNEADGWKPLPLDIARRELAAALEVQP